MDKASASKFKANVLSAMRELASALRDTERASSKDEAVLIKKHIGHIIAELHDLLKETAYKHHPELDDLL